MRENRTTAHPQLREQRLADAIREHRAMVLADPARTQEAEDRLWSVLDELTAARERDASDTDPATPAQGGPMTETTQMLPVRTLRFDNVEIDVPRGDRITLTIADEEETPVDLTEAAPVLVASGLARPVATNDDNVVFGELDTSDHIAARVNGQPLALAQMLEALSAGLTHALRHAVDTFSASLEPGGSGDSAPDTDQ